MPRARKLYSLLLKLYPARFREEYETPLELEFSDEYREIATRTGRARFWLRTLADLAVSVPAESLRQIRQDLRYALRVYRTRALAASLTLAALTLAIGASTGVFSVVNALLLRSLPFREPDRVAIDRAVVPILYTDESSLATWRRTSAYLEQAAAFRSVDMNLGTDREAGRIHVAETSVDFFSVLGTRPLIGRTFAAGESSPGRNTLAVLAYGLWQQMFGGDPAVLGREVRLNGVPLTVVGVAPSGFDYPGKVSLWTPTYFDRELLPKDDPDFGYTIARLKPGISVASADRLYDAEFRRAFPAVMKNQPPDQRWASLEDQLVGPVRKASLVLLGAVIFVLLIACANVGQLLLARTSEQRRKFVIRAALGASRARLVRQLITESTLLTLLAAASGLGVAHWAASLAAGAQPARLSTQQYTILDWRVLAFAAAAALLTGLVFGVLPASLVGRLQTAPDSARARAAVWGRDVRRMRAVLIAMQAALALILLTGSLTLGRSFLRLLGTDLGFRTANVATLSVSLSGTRAHADHREDRYYREALDRLRSLPGVESAGGVTFLPLVPQTMSVYRYHLDSGPQAWAIDMPATPGYFRSLGASLVEGRDFTDADRQGSERVAIVDAELARKLGGGASLVGRRLTTPDAADQPVTRTIVGVVRTIRFSPTEASSPGQVYIPVAQEPPTYLTFVARVHGNPEGYLSACREALRTVDPRVALFSVETLDRKLAEKLAKPRFYTTAVLFFAVLALLLAAVGTYGVATHTIAQQTHEIGVRIAVGASPSHLRTRLLARSMLPVMVGIAIGTAGAAGLGRVITHLLASAEPSGIRAALIATAVLAAAAALSIRTATARILRMDPTAALKAE